MTNSTFAPNNKVSIIVAPPPFCLLIYITISKHLGFLMATESELGFKHETITDVIYLVFKI